ncbi:MAG: polysaccharide deacetylase [Conexibacter sp.]|nr:polysaccharide deacetylase [Conexibacter sp.]
MTAEPRAASGPAVSTFPILLYHRIGTSSRSARGGEGQRFDVNADAFASQMDLLAASGRRSFAISDLLPCREAAATTVAVTFDDGTADFYRTAWPILREREIAVTLYVTSGLVGKSYLGSEMLSWEQLEELRDGGVEIGAHGYHHIALDLVSLERAAIECINSKLALEDRLQRAVTSFAYPFGYHTDPLKRLLPKIGYSSACAVKNALSHPRDDPFGLARLTVSGDLPARRFEQLLSGNGARMAWDGERPRTRVWRAYRHARSRTRRFEH